MIDGLAVVDKPAGMTSHDVVSRCRRIFGQRRVGHAGTLDPDATGVLLVGLGRATRLMRFMSGLDKAYTCDIVLGRATSTLDASGEETGRWDMWSTTPADARCAAAALTGPILQVPPMVSAVKVGGRRLHELARAGVEVERAARPVTVHRFDVEPGTGRGGDPGPVLRAAVSCSSGTYIRVLADDLGRALGGGAHLRDLRRVQVGPWSEAVAVPLERTGPEHVLAPADSLPWLPSVTVSGPTEEAVRHGGVLPVEVLTGFRAAANDGGGEPADPGVGTEPAAGGPWRVLSGDGHLLAVYETHGPGRAKPAVVMVSGGETGDGAGGR